MSFEPKAEIRELTNEEYHACEGLSSSSIKLLLECPKIYHYQYVLGNRTAETKPMKLGTALHTLILEPNKFSNNYHAMDSMPRKGSKNYDVAMSMFPDKIWISQDDLFMIKDMADSLKSEGYIDFIFSGGYVVEQSIFFLYDFITLKYHAIPKTPELLSKFLEENPTIFLLKARPDIINYGVNLIFDVKSSANASRYAFQKQKSEYKLDVQAAIQQMAVEALTGNKFPINHIAIDKRPPHPIGYYEATEPEIEMGKFKINMALQYLYDCKRLGAWRSFTTHSEWAEKGGKELIQQLPLAAWAENKFNNEGLLNE
jgi:hypothetical protein